MKITGDLPPTLLHLSLKVPWEEGLLLRVEVDEYKGLKVTQKDGKRRLDVDSLGRPQLEKGDKEPLDPKTTKRITGDDEFEHEAALFKDHPQKFEDLNMMVRTWLKKIGKRPPSIWAKWGRFVIFPVLCLLASADTALKS